MITERELFEALKGVTDPELGKDIVELSMVRDLRKMAKVLKRFLTAYGEHEEDESEHRGQPFWGPGDHMRGSVPLANV